MLFWNFKIKLKIYICLWIFLKLERITRKQEKKQKQKTKCEIRNSQIHTDKSAGMQLLALIYKQPYLYLNHHSQKKKQRFLRFMKKRKLVQVRIHTFFSSTCIFDFSFISFIVAFWLFCFDELVIDDWYNFQRCSCSFSTQNYDQATNKSSFTLKSTNILRKRKRRRTEFVWQ